MYGETAPACRSTRRSIPGRSSTSAPARASGGTSRSASASTKARRTARPPCRARFPVRSCSTALGRIAFGVSDLDAQRARRSSPVRLHAAAQRQASASMSCSARRSSSCVRMSCRRVTFTEAGPPVHQRDRDADGDRARRFADRLQHRRRRRATSSTRRRPSKLGGGMFLRYSGASAECRCSCTTRSIPTSAACRSASAAGVASKPSLGFREFAADTRLRDCRSFERSNL